MNDTQRKINAIRSNLPDGVKEPSLSQFSLSDLPVVSMGLPPTYLKMNFMI